MQPVHQATTPVQPPTPVSSKAKLLDRPGSGRGFIELARFLADPLVYLPRIAKEHGGPLVPFQLGRLPATLVTKPEYIKQGLQNEEWPPISRGRLINLYNWYSGGLFITYGTEHHRQRDEIWKPWIEDPILPELTTSLTDEWTGAWQDGSTHDAFKELRALCYSIDWKAMVGEDLRQNPPLLTALETGAETLPWLLLPLAQKRWGLPLPATIRAKRDEKLLNEVITRLIAERRKNRGIQDMLGKLVARRDEAGSKTTDPSINSNVMMYFGADQLHALFAWTYLLLAQNPKVEAKLHEELDRELEGPATTADLPKLRYLHNVIMESMRVIPPVHGFFRELAQDYQLGDTRLPKGSMMVFSPWVTHRDERYWPDPMKFDPDRWLPDRKRPPALAFFPMSAGPYRCHGAELAMTQAFLVIANISRRWTLRPTSSTPPKPLAMWSTEPKGGMPMRVTKRK